MGLSPWQELENARTPLEVRRAGARGVELAHVDRAVFAKGVHEARKCAWRRHPKRMTESLFRELHEGFGGFCVGCGELRWSGCAPDERCNICGGCNDRLVYGAELAVRAGLLVVEAPLDGHSRMCELCLGVVVVTGQQGAVITGKCRGCGAESKREVE